MQNLFAIQILISVKKKTILSLAKAIVIKTLHNLTMHIIFENVTVRSYPIIKVLRFLRMDYYIEEMAL